MDKKKQIEEMACKNCIHYEVCLYVNAQAVEYARAENCKLFRDTAGYRKQSEWISVEERLPQVDTDVLVITANGSFKVARCNIYHNGTLVLWMTNDGLGERAITHWMPLPELPEESEGSENG